MEKLTFAAKVILFVTALPLIALVEMNRPVQKETPEVVRPETVESSEQESKTKSPAEEKATVTVGFVLFSQAF